MHLGLKERALCAPVFSHRSPAALLKFKMAPRLMFLMFSGSQKKESRYACLNETRASLRHRMCTEFSSSASHFLHSGLSVNLSKWRCLRRVLCPVRSLVTTLDCILLKDKSLTLVPWQGPDINSWACQWVLPRFCQRLQCWFPDQWLGVNNDSATKLDESGWNF
jgi:hypothetical protein